jgi:hypothetical protein
VVFAVLLVAWGLGTWLTVFRGAEQELTGVFVARLGGGMILVQHEVLPGLGMGAMELMAIVVEPETLLDEAALAGGERVRLGVRRRPEGLVATRVVKVTD